MSLSKSRAVTSITLLGLGLTAFWAWGYPRIQVHYFSRALVHVSETVSVREQSFLVSGGRVGGIEPTSKTLLPVLKLAYRKAVVKHNPLMDISGTDPQKLLLAVSNLQTTADLLASIQTDSRSMVENHMYPTEFLKELAVLAQYRLAFMNDGTDISADAYDTQMVKTIAAYQNELADFKMSFQTTVPSTIKKYATAGSIVSYDSILSALDTLSAGIERTASLEHNRAQCVSGFIWYCSESDLALPTLTAPQQETSNRADTDRALRVRNIYADALSAPQFNTLPLFELSTSSCVSKIGSPIFIIRPTTEQRLGIASFSYPMYVGDVRLIDSSTQASIPFISYFAQHDTRYVPASPVDYYECPTSAGDFGKLRSMQSIVEFALATPLSAYTSGTYAQSLRALEAGFATRSTPILERDTLMYADEARSLMLQKALPDNIANHVLSMLLTVRNQSSQFDTIIDNISLTERGNIYLDSKGVPVALSPTYLFFLRSGVFALFMDHNPSVIGTHEPLLPPNTISASREPYVYYSSLSQSAHTDKEIIEDLRFFAEIHRPLVAER